MAGRAGVGHAEGRGGLGHRRLEGVVAATHQQAPVDVAHVAADAPAALRVGAVERVGGNLLVGPRNPAVGTIGRAARDARPGRRVGHGRPFDRRCRRRLMALRAELVAGAAVVHVHLEREIEGRAVRHVAVRAGDRARLEAARERERLRTVEAVGPAVGPELALRVELGQRLADQERQRVVLVAVAGRKRGEQVALVAVAVGAAVERAPRVGRARREDLERVGELTVGGPRAVARHRRRILGPAFGQRDVRAAGAVAGLAADAHLGPVRAVGLGGRVVAAVEVGGMAVEAVDVPDLLQVVRAVGDRRGLLPVEPAAALHVPEHGQHVHPPVGQRREIALEAFRPQGVVDAIRLGRTIAGADRHDRAPILLREGVGAAVGTERGPAREVAEQRGLGHRPRHLDVERGLPLRVGLLVARLARRRADVADVDRQGCRRQTGGRRRGDLAIAARRHHRRRDQQRRRHEQQTGACPHRLAE